MGTVRDGETGEPLAAATVTLTDLDRFATADANGRYELFDIPAGPHRVLVRFMGYVPRSLQALVPPSACWKSTSPCTANRSGSRHSR